MQPIFLSSFGEYEPNHTLIVLGIILIPATLYILTLYKTISLIKPGNRKLSKIDPWLLLVPVFNIIWHFMVVSNLAKSIESECKSRNIEVEPKPTYDIGLAMCVLTICGIIPIVGIFARLGSLGCWIAYWIKVNKFKKMFQTHR